MATTHLSLPLRLPENNIGQYELLSELTARVSNHLLRIHWTPSHLTGISESSYQAWKYFDEASSFDDFDVYLPSRYKRCLLQKVGETLRSHAEKRDAFWSVKSILPDHKIRRIHRRQIKQTLWESGEYLTSRFVDLLIEQLNGYYDRHGTYPESYFDIQECPSYERGILPYSADDGPLKGQAIKYGYDGDTRCFKIQLKIPDTLTPKTQGDWRWVECEIKGYELFGELMKAGEMSAPSFHPARTKGGIEYFDVLVPIEITNPRKEDSIKTVLALDGGLRKDITAVIVDHAGEQQSTPYFIKNTVRDGMHGLHRERTRLNNRLSTLRQRGEAHTDRFKHVQSEYERVNNKIGNKREQLVHDIANQVLALALLYDVYAIVHEDLRSLSPPRGEGRRSWELSAWSRRQIIEKIEYRADLAGLHVKRVFPQNTSRSCPRCGSTGHTTKSPGHQEEIWWGSHFRCDNTRCGFQADRDYVGALNVARVYFGNSRSLDHGFRVSYIGTTESVLAGRPAGTRLTFGRNILAYEFEQSRTTAGGGSCSIAPAVVPTETKNDSSTSTVSGPATSGGTRFIRAPAESCRK